MPAPPATAASLDKNRYTESLRVLRELITMYGNGASPDALLEYAHQHGLRNVEHALSRCIDRATSIAERVEAVQVALHPTSNSKAMLIHTVLAPDERGPRYMAQAAAKALVVLDPGSAAAVLGGMPLRVEALEDRLRREPEFTNALLQQMGLPEAWCTLTAQEVTGPASLLAELFKEFGGERHS